MVSLCLKRWHGWFRIANVESNSTNKIELFLWILLSKQLYESCLYGILTTRTHTDNVVRNFMENFSRPKIKIYWFHLSYCVFLPAVSVEIFSITHNKRKHLLKMLFFDRYRYDIKNSDMDRRMNLARYQNFKNICHITLAPCRYNIYAQVLIPSLNNCKVWALASMWCINDKKKKEKKHQLIRTIFYFSRNKVFVIVVF